MFAKRSEEIEIMDDLAIQGEVIDKTLKELEFINAWLGGNDIIIDALNKIVSTYPKNKLLEELTIADLGCGGGDILKLISRWAKKKNIKVKLIGIDANPNIIEYARRNSKEYSEISFQTMDIFSEEFKEKKFDIITCTLFCHHFNDTSLTNLFRQLYSQVSIGIIINDLHRHWFAYHSIKWLTAIFSRSYMVKNDAKVSVLRSFLKTELINILTNAGIKNFEIAWKWAFRYQVIINKA